jgi:hypothetical protein
MKPEVIKIFEDLDVWRNHCRFNLLKFDPADLYRSDEWKEFSGKPVNKKKPRREYKKENK